MKINFKEKFMELKIQQKIAAVIICVVLFIDIVLGIVILVNKNHSSTYLEAVGFNGKSNLIALNGNARNSFIKDDDYACYGFTDSQKQLFNLIFQENGTAALTIRLNLSKNQKQLEKVYKSDSLRFGFLYKDDFSGKNKLKKYILDYSKKTEISGNEDNINGLIDLSFALPKNNDNIPEGFFVYSSCGCKISGACIGPAVVGFDISESIPFYGFAYNGGKIDFTNSHFDFSGASLVFPVQNTEKYVLPEFCVKFNSDVQYKSSLESNYYVDIKFGGEKFSLKNVKNADEVIIPCGAVSFPFQNMEITKNKDILTSVLLRPVKKTDGNKVLSPVKIDPGLILNYNLKDWRCYEYEIFEWDRIPGILFFDIRNYAIQDKFFSRLAYYVEKEGFKGTLLTNEQLDGKHGYNAHDYSSDSLASFFNKAADDHFILNEEELLLKEILIKNKLLEYEGDGLHVKPLEGGLVSLSRETKDWSRKNLLAHEGFHTLFFKDAEFRNFVAAVYGTCDYKSLEFVHDYFKSQPSLGYDQNDEYLMHNEFMAYLMQSPMNGVADYFVHQANRGSVIAYTPELCAYIRQTKASGLEDAAAAINDFIFDKYGVVAGSIALVRRAGQNQE